jgi:hypothetical protein
MHISCAMVLRFMSLLVFRNRSRRMIQKEYWVYPALFGKIRFYPALIRIDP